MIGKQSNRKTFAIGRLARMFSKDRRASMTLLIAGAIPLLIGFSALGMDAVRLFSQAQRINQAAEMAALAAGTKLPTYYSTNSTATMVSAANTILTANTQGTWTIAPAVTVTIGTWTSANNTFASGGTAPNAVQTTVTATTSTLVTSIMGGSTATVTKTAIAKLGGIHTVNVVVVNDLSSSFSTQIVQQRAADVAILNCIASTSSSTSKFGVSSFNGTSSTYIPLQTVTAANKTTLTNSVNAMAGCTSSGSGTNPPKCGGSNAAAGIYNAMTQLAALNCSNCSNNIVIITDGVPSYNSGVSYTQATGTYVTTTGTGTNMVGTGKGTTPICGVGSANSCGSPTNSNSDPVPMLAMANGQAKAAGAAGMLVSTIYYTGSTSGSTKIAAYEAELAGWVQNGGVNMNIPTAAQITSSSSGVCSLFGVGIARASL